MKREERQSLLQRCIKWREANIKEKQFILILSFLVGIFTAIAALFLKFLIHQIQNFLTNNFNATSANYLYLVYPVIGIFLAGWFVRNIVKDDISHGVTKILYAISRRQGRIKRHNIWSSTIASAITIGFGGSVGAEAPIVLTGSQKPIDKEDTDARINLRDAFSYAASEKSAQVTIVFHGKAIAGTRAKKIRTKSFNAFDSVDFPVLATVREGKVLQYIEPPESVKNAAAPDFYKRLDGKVGLCCLTPGFSGAVLDSYFENNDAVVLSGYGTGGIPGGEYYDLYDVIEKWRGKGKTLVVTTQVQSEGSDMGIYRVGRDFKERFSVLESYDMTWESIITKLMWILSETRDEKEIERLFYKPVNYDLIV